MKRISKKRFYLAFAGEVVAFIAGISALAMTYMEPEHGIYYALVAIWMYTINKDYGKYTEQYLKQEQENESTR
jgi:hypothetical protein